MSTEYTSDLNYDHVISTIKDIKVQKPTRIIYSIEHKILRKNGIAIFIFKNENGKAGFERFGFNDPTEILNTITKQYPDANLNANDGSWPPNDE
jgi:hypothetical protein